MSLKILLTASYLMTDREISAVHLSHLEILLNMYLPMAGPLQGRGKVEGVATTSWRTVFGLQKFGHWQKFQG